MEDKELLWALKNGDLDEVKTRLLTVEDVNRTMVNGRKPLHIAADYGQPELIEFLCSLGADVNASDRHGMTPLICACFEDHVACVKVLLEKGADKGQKTPDGRCAFDCAENADIKALLQ